MRERWSKNKIQADVQAPGLLGAGQIGNRRKRRPDERAVVERDLRQVRIAASPHVPASVERHGKLLVDALEQGLGPDPHFSVQLGCRRGLGPGVCVKDRAIAAAGSAAARAASTARTSASLSSANLARTCRNLS